MVEPIEIRSLDPICQDNYEVDDDVFCLKEGEGGVTSWIRGRDSQLKVHNGTEDREKE